MNSMVTYLEDEEKTQFFRHAELAGTSASELSRLLIRKYLRNRAKKMQV